METKYVIASEEMKRLENIFTYHTPKPGQPERYEVLRGFALDFAVMIS
jgi:hypothetical protein